MKNILIGYALIVCLVSCESNSRKYTLSDHFDGDTFNNIPKTRDKSIFDLLKWKFSTTVKEWPSEVDNKKFNLPKIKKNETIITWINHASFLIQTPKLNIITDPVYSLRVSPFSFVGPKRVRKPGVSFDSLPQIDVVIISHNHYDHLDIETLKRISKKFKPLILVPLGDKSLLQKNNISNVVEMDWLENRAIKESSITFLPAKHWSARWVTDKRESLWGSFMIESSGKTIYFGGDTGFGKHFKEISSKFSQIDLALLPIGAYEPRWFMREFHMNPDDSVLAHIDLKARKSIGMHFGTFQLTNEGIDEPEIDLVKARKKYKIVDSDFFVLSVGGSYFMY